MSHSKAIAGVSLDLDDLWSYMKIHADSGWESFPSFLPIAVPRILEILRERSLIITFFATGKDASFERNEELLRRIVQEGHEIGNHSYNHEPWFHQYSEKEIEREIADTETALEKACGKKPLGFRGPGYSITPGALKVLARRGYVYDSSSLPSLITPIARAYYFSTKRFSKSERETRKNLGGSFSEGLGPLVPYCWDTPEQSIIELPITTLPFFRIPIHASYLYALSAFSRSLALSYFRLALRALRRLRIPLTCILHPLDFLGMDDDAAVPYFPAMSWASEKKISFMTEVIGIIMREFEIVPLCSLAEEMMERGRMAHFPLIR